MKRLCAGQKVSTPFSSLPILTASISITTFYYNSTALDCTRKFRDFLGSARTLRRLSDRVCLENGLSYIAHPKLKSKGQYKHYGQWLGGSKPLTFQERLKAQIDICPQGKILKMCKCQYTCPACHLVESLKMHEK